MNALDQLTLIFRDIFDHPSLVLHPETSPNDISDWDSVAQVKLVLAIEEECNLRFKTDQVAQLHSVGDFLAAIQAAQGSAD